jgi:hypothetical protein
MSDDQRGSDRTLDQARALIDLFLKSVPTEDVRQLVREMETELARPIHLSLVLSRGANVKGVI